MSVPRFKPGDRVRLVNILPECEFPKEPNETGRLIQTNVWRNGRMATVVSVGRTGMRRTGMIGFSGNSRGDEGYDRSKFDDYSYNIKFDRFEYSDSSDGHTSNGYFLEADGPTDEEMQMIVESISKANRRPTTITIHWMHPDARDPDFEGCSAFCDWMLGLDDEPRTHTLSSVVREEIDCNQCLSLMERVGEAYDLGWAERKDDLPYKNRWWGEPQ